MPGNSLLTGQIQGKTADFASIRARCFGCQQVNSGLGEISLSLLTGNFCARRSSFSNDNCRMHGARSDWPAIRQSRGGGDSAAC